MQIKKRPQQETLHDEPHPKQDFQVERIAFFSDAVFAIAITLLIIEFHPPHVTRETTYADVWHELKDMRFKLIALLLSFVLIIGYWMRHHTLFKYVHNYNKEIVLANMALLFPIIFFPFTTSFLYESLNGTLATVVIPYRLFMFNNILAGAFTYYFFWLIVRKHKGHAYPMRKEDKSEFNINVLISTISFTLVLVLSFYSIEKSAWGIVPFALYRFYLKFIKKTKNTPVPNAKQTGGPGH
ncbi:MAG TPA: TMEM175 family protein [Chitinophagaceae bacterium]|nr:TMEM175 family protein [Chitinophagaceae bacterium]